MPHAPTPPEDGQPLDLAAIAQVIAEAVRPEHFVAAADLNLTWHHGPETTPWELFRGHALDHTQTRKRATFVSWNVRCPDGDEPLLSVKLDAAAGQVHVTRSVRCHTWEGYVEKGQALSREVVRRVRELVGTINLRQMNSALELSDELTALLFRAVVGASRLPLTSLEAPLPEFTFGQLVYCPSRSSVEAAPLLDGSLPPLTEHRFLEFAIRSTPAEQIARIAEARLPRLRGPSLFRAMFNDLALSPYTDFVAKSLALVRELVAATACSAEDEIDLLTHLLRQICRHLTSFDLVRFHHRGANYPDALLLEEVMERVWRLAEERGDAFLTNALDDQALAKSKRLRRRALRQAWLIRRRYQGHLVPDAPTSPGENARVLPAPHRRVPEEQISAQRGRTRRLFPERAWFDRPTAAVEMVLRACIADLAEKSERLELGLGLFLDRPFGFAKSPGEPDATLMLAHEAFSAQIARERRDLLSEIDPGLRTTCNVDIPGGVAWYCPVPRQRPGVVSVQDAQLAAPDFVYLRSVRRSVAELLDQYDFASLGPATDWLRSERCLVLPSMEAPDELTIHDSAWHLRLRLRLDASGGYESRRGVEYLVAGLMALEARHEDGSTAERSGSQRVLPREPAAAGRFSAAHPPR